LAGSTYNIQNYPALQNGWTLSGTITTDGAIGFIQASDITSWAWTVTSGGDTFTFKSTDPQAGLLLPSDTLRANSEDLLLTLPSGFEFLTEAAELAYVSRGTPLTITSAAVLLPLPFDVLWNTEISTPPGLDAWAIASRSTSAVPEPCTLYLLGFGAAFGSLYVVGRKRRAGRTATTDA
jgi:hypothetical protein